MRLRGQQDPSPRQGAPKIENAEKEEEEKD